MARDWRFPRLQVAAIQLQNGIIAADWGDEDAKNIQLIGRAGQLCRREFRKCRKDLDFDKDFWKTNAVICRPRNEKGGNRTPTGKEIWACRPNLLNTIAELEPHVIIPMGGVAVESLIGHRFSDSTGGIGRWRGFKIPDRNFNAWICPLFHPSYLMRQTSSQVASVIFRKDLKEALSCIDKPLPKFKDEEKRVTISLSSEKTNAYLKQIIREQPKRLAVDFETTGIKPHRKGHQIFSCALSTNPFSAFSFLMRTADPKLLKKILRNKRIKKIAANVKYEQEWSSVILGYLIRGWDWDTMLTAHALDNRRGIVALRFQAYVCFGIADYESEISHLLKSKKGQKKKHGANGFNVLYYELQNKTLSKHLRRRILVYGGMDAMLEHRLDRKQRKTVRKGGRE